MIKKPTIKSLAAVPVFFRPEMAADAGSYSPSAGKPPLVVRDWTERSLPVAVRSFEPVDVATLELAHDTGYVRGILNGSISNGFGNRKPEVAASLRYTSGAMLAAAREAIANGQVACAPVSGFHHAHHASAGGFCTFNGLMVTAMALKRDSLAQRVGILDLDFHWGDGTEDIRHRVDAKWVQHQSPGDRPLGAADASGYLDGLPSLVSGFADCDVLLYQAGADAHVDDPLGGWMTTAQLAERDRIVFATAAEVGLPIAWDLAGGYQSEADGRIPAVLEIHRNTMKVCADVYVRLE